MAITTEAPLYDLTQGTNEIRRVVIARALASC
jgi:hypothetical protein